MTAFRLSIMPAFLTACLLFGGSSSGGFLANLLLQLCALAILAVAATARSEKLPEKSLVPLMLAGLVFLVTLIQLIPLPPLLWQMLPGREAVANGFALRNVLLPWLPISLTPADTVQSLLWLLPAMAMLVGLLVLGTFRARDLSVCIIAVAVLSVAIGAIQLAGGPQSRLYLYDPTNRGIAVGLFANGNHFATMMLVSLPFIAAVYRTLPKGSGQHAIRVAGRAACGGAVVAVVAGLAINGSLAGMGLLVPVALASLLIGWSLPTGLLRKFAPAIAGVAVAAAAVVLFGPFDNNLFGASAQNNGQSRATAFALTAQAIARFAPSGSGFGSFIEVYRTMEDPTTIDRFYMNNAHNDYLQLALEGGLPAVLLILAGLGWIIVRTKAIWQQRSDDPFAQAATIATAAILAHSLVDYPLRTAALSAVLAACLALLAQPTARNLKQPRRKDGGAVHLQAD